MRREPKQMKRESPPPRGPGSLSDSMKGRETIVKEAGRSIHLIPREELRQPGKEGIIVQVHTLKIMLMTHVETIKHFMLAN